MVSLLFWGAILLVFLSYLLRPLGIAALVAPALTCSTWPFLRWNSTRKALSVVFLLACEFSIGLDALSGIALTTVAIVHAVCVFGLPGGVTVSVLLTVHAYVGTLLNRGDHSAALLQAAIFAMFAAWALVTACVLLSARERARESELLLTRVRELTVAEERARMSREMHDSIGHYLTVIILGLQNAQRYRAARDDEAWAEIRQAQQLAQEALADTRRWVRALKPLAMEGKAGPEAMAELARSFTGTGLDVSFQAEDVALEGEAELVLYRALQEGLTNAVRHSGARRVAIRLTQNGKRVELSISDDGQGAAADALDGGHGLAGLRQRVAALAGSLRTESPPEGGFRLRVSVPGMAT